MFCLLHSCIVVHPGILENTEDSLIKHAPYIVIYENHNASISAMLDSFHNIIAVRSVSAIFMPRTKAIRR